MNSSVRAVVLGGQTVRSFIEGLFLCAFETLQKCKRFMNSRRNFVAFRENACGWRVEGPNYKSAIKVHFSYYKMLIFPL